MEKCSWGSISTIFTDLSFLLSFICAWRPLYFSLKPKLAEQLSSTTYWFVLMDGLDGFLSRIFFKTKMQLRLHKLKCWTSMISTPKLFVVSTALNTSLETKLLQIYQKKSWCSKRAQIRTRDPLSSAVRASIGFRSQHFWIFCSSLTKKSTWISMMLTLRVCSANPTNIWMKLNRLKKMEWADSSCLVLSSLAT